ncbi:class I SAM-dependent methyltransferase [Candidatus Parcubacteria bacterium]|nr:class I SAM-dependent methyltransferase [Patescibacteria group bacterium]MCG2699677.1 class I SAM-dependent methyltransferase [Candidatus Parcubacteria bacterium]
MDKHYNFFKYDYKDRWTSYWHQIDEVLKLRPKTVLEIGIGNGTVADCLKKQGLKVKTLDISEDLRPDFIADVMKMPIDNNSFSVVLCAEILEHLPFKDFEKALLELKRVTKKYVVLSLPHFGPPIKISFKIPFIKEIKIVFKIPYHPKHKSGRVHYWEIGKKGYSPRKIRNIIKKYFEIQNDFVPFENQYHHFYILKK